MFMKALTSVAFSKEGEIEEEKGRIKEEAEEEEKLSIPAAPPS